MKCYGEVFWDISGVCNSNCKYCCNGKNSISGDYHKKMSRIMTPETFSNTLDYLTSKGIIHPEKTVIYLFNWGDPFIHPQFGTMLEIVSSRGYKYNLSTNGSIVKDIPLSAVQYLQSISFSMPGFSQESYDRIHGFDFNTICNNIKTIVNQIRSISNHVMLTLNYHKYQFNLHEIEASKEFCYNLGMGHFQFFAYFTGYTMAKMFYEGFEVPKDELILDELEQIRIRKPYGWVCPQYSGLTLDVNANVLQCCATDKMVEGNIIGNVKETDFDTLTNTRMRSEACKLCYEMGHCYVIHNAFY